MPTAQEFLNDPAWVSKWKNAFDNVYDADKNGYLTQSDFLRIRDRYAAIVTDRPDILKIFEEALLELAKVYGVTGQESKVDWDTALQSVAKYAEIESAKIEKGEETLFHKVENASFDLVDQNKDGYVSWEEYLVVMKAWNHSEDTARSIFDRWDKRKDTTRPKKPIKFCDYTTILDLLLLAVRCKLDSYFSCFPIQFFCFTREVAELN